jgi:hypothetical protein
MKNKQIKLKAKERTELEQFCKKGVHSVRLINRAKIILSLDTSGGRKGQKQKDIAERVGVSRQAVNDARNDFLVIKSVSEFLKRKKRVTPPVPPKITGEFEARVIALACGSVPKGYAKWSLRLLADKCVELQYIDTISHTAISTLLKKHNLSPI